MRIVSLNYQICKRLVMKHHYSRCMPGSVRYRWGLVDNYHITGCVCYGYPPSFTLRRGICGSEFTDKVIELSRLVITTGTPNAASYLIARSLHKLNEIVHNAKKERRTKEEDGFVIVSYADPNERAGHVGKVYQASSWLYVGRSSRQWAWALENDHKESGLPAGTIVSEVHRHIERKARRFGFDWADNASKGPGLERVAREGKHRYVTFVGDRGFRRRAREALRYRVEDYPDGPSKRHPTLEYNNDQDEQLDGVRAGGR